MAKKKEDKTIDGIHYQMEQYDARQGLVLLAKLQKIFAKPLGMIFDALFSHQESENHEAKSQ